MSSSSPTRVGALNVKFYQGSSGSGPGSFSSTTDYLDGLLAKYGGNKAHAASGAPNYRPLDASYTSYASYGPPGGPYGPAGPPSHPYEQPSYGYGGSPPPYGGGYPPPAYPAPGQYAPQYAGHPPAAQPPPAAWGGGHEPPRSVGIVDRMRQLEELRQKIMQGPDPLKSDSEPLVQGLEASYGSSFTRSQITAPPSGGDLTPEASPPPAVTAPRSRPRRTRNGSTAPPSQAASTQPSPLPSRPPSRGQTEAGGGSWGAPPPPAGSLYAGGKRRPSRRGGSSAATSRGLSPEASRPLSPLPPPEGRQEGEAPGAEVLTVHQGHDAAAAAAEEEEEKQDAGVQQANIGGGAVLAPTMSIIHEEGSRFSADLTAEEPSDAANTRTDGSTVAAPAAASQPHDAAEPSPEPPAQPAEAAHHQQAEASGTEVSPSAPPEEEPVGNAEPAVAEEEEAGAEGDVADAVGMVLLPGAEGSEPEGDVDGIEARLAALMGGEGLLGSPSAEAPCPSPKEAGGNPAAATEAAPAGTARARRPQLQVEVPRSPVSPAVAAHPAQRSRSPSPSTSPSPAASPSQLRQQATTQAPSSQLRPKSAAPKTRPVSSRPHADKQAAPRTQLEHEPRSVSAREAAERERAMELYRRAASGRALSAASKPSPRRAEEAPLADQLPPRAQKTFERLGQQSASAAHHRRTASDALRLEYSKKGADHGTTGGNKPGRRAIKSATVPPPRTASASRAPRSASSTPRYAAQPGATRRVVSARNTARPPAAAVRDLFTDDPVPLFAVSLSRAPRAKGPRRIQSAHPTLRAAARHAESQAARATKRIQSAHPAPRSPPARGSRSSARRSSASGALDSGPGSNGLPFQDAVARMEDELDGTIHALDGILQERRQQQEVTFGAAFSRLVGAATLEEALHPPGERRVQSAATGRSPCASARATAGGRTDSSRPKSALPGSPARKARPPSARPAPTGTAKAERDNISAYRATAKPGKQPAAGKASPKGAEPVERAASAAEAHSEEEQLRRDSAGAAAEARRTRPQLPRDAPRSERQLERGIARVDVIAAKWKLEGGGDKYDVIQNWQVEHDEKTLAALRGRTGARGRPGADASAMFSSGRSVETTLSVRHTWWGGVNEEDAERLWVPSPQASQGDVASLIRRRPQTQPQAAPE